MKLFTQKWTVVIAFSSLLAVQTASATLPQDWQILSKAIEKFLKWGDMFSDTSNPTSLSTCAARIFAIKDDLKNILPVPGGVYTKAELHIRQIAQQLDTNAAEVCNMLKQNTNALKLGPVLKAYGMADKFKDLQEKLEELIKANDKYPELVSEMRSLQNVLEQKHQKWSQEGLLALTKIVLHRCKCK